MEKAYTFLFYLGAVILAVGLTIISPALGLCFIGSLFMILAVVYAVFNDFNKGEK